MKYSSTGVPQSCLAGRGCISFLPSPESFRDSFFLWQWQKENREYIL